MTAPAPTPASPCDPLVFYRLQHEWSDVVARDVDNFERQRAATVERQSSGSASRRVLELGAGGGQAAIATAERGFAVDAIELVPELSQQMRRLVAKHEAANVRVFEGDFYTVDLAGPYDIVCYWDGFGVGTDRDQLRLLDRIRSWLAPGGRALIEVYSPWYWSRVAGTESAVDRAGRRYDFDHERSVMIDRWWKLDAPEEVVEQHLRCYAPADLELLADRAGLDVVEIQPGGSYNWETRTYVAEAPIASAMSYLAVLSAR